MFYNATLFLFSNSIFFSFLFLISQDFQYSVGGKGAILYPSFGSYCNKGLLNFITKSGLLLFAKRFACLVSYIYI